MNIEEAIEVLNQENTVYKKIKAIETIRNLEIAYEKEKEENKRLRKCHLQYEEMTGIDLLLPSKEE